MSGALDIAAQVAGMAVGQGMGVINADWEDRRQLEQQKRLQALQIRGSKEMMDYQNQLSMDIWNKTNYAAQTKKMREAGLNVGLMYKGAGEGGKLMQPTASVTGATSPGGVGERMRGMEVGLQAAMQAAQIRNLEANTRKTEADTIKTTGVDTAEGWARIDKLKAETENIQLQSVLNNLGITLKQIEVDIATQTAPVVIEKTKRELETYIEQIRQLRNQNQITEETMNATIYQSIMATEEQALRIAAQKLGLTKTEAETKQINANIQKIFNDIWISGEQLSINWQQLGINDAEMLIKNVFAKNDTLMTLFNTSTPEQLKQWSELFLPFLEIRAANKRSVTSAATDLVGGMPKGGGMRKIGY